MAALTAEVAAAETRALAEQKEHMVVEAVLEETPMREWMAIQVMPEQTR